MHSAISRKLPKVWLACWCRVDRSGWLVSRSGEHSALAAVIGFFFLILAVYFIFKKSGVEVVSNRSNDLLKCSDEEIKNTKVLYTIVNGKIAYEAK